MSRQRTAINLRKGVKISKRTKKLYEQRDKSLDRDPDTRRLPPEKWAEAMRRKEFFRVTPVKKPIALRIDTEIIAWLKSQGPGYQTRINEILRERMAAEMAAAQQKVQ
jgi:uncharacterized protein (DUF4415 family)